jgi:hypothetical protein
LQSKHSSPRSRRKKNQDDCDILLKLWKTAQKSASAKETEVGKKQK